MKCAKKYEIKREDTKLTLHIRGRPVIYERKTIRLRSCFFFI